MQGKYDAILIPGGGVTEEGIPPPWVKARLDEAIKQSKGIEYLVTMSAGTVHKPPPLDQNRLPIFESIAAANYLIENEINPDRVLPETCSYDTIGNAYFSRVIHTDPRKFTDLLIITSEFHMPRTKEIFNWVFGLEPQDNFKLEYKEVPNIGIDEKALQARIEKESRGLEKVLSLKSQIHSLEELHKWLYTEHGAYALGADVERVKGDVERSY